MHLKTEKNRILRSRLRISKLDSTARGRSSNAPSLLNNLIRHRPRSNCSQTIRKLQVTAAAVESTNISVPSRLFAFPETSNNEPSFRENSVFISAARRRSRQRRPRRTGKRSSRRMSNRTFADLPFVAQRFLFPGVSNRNRPRNSWEPRYATAGRIRFDSSAEIA